MKATTRVLGPLQYLIVALTLLTAIVHLTLNFPETLFVLNGLGYLGLVAMLYLPLPLLNPYHTLIRWLLITYTAVTVALWLFISPTSPFTAPLAAGMDVVIAYIDKVAEVLLIVLLWMEGQQ